ncbi:type II toxin-antitoxin system RelE family toxin [Moorella sp. Hama-1]|uniref:type II toxin-antitoxin system RelE family toxin n=1 Tax=Moorella sp. Hama-1 TaxID=2138101 RepID=UPI000D646870|nr:type II toxin-antitoxin system RelE/ParE family toxin [Moorella sp. Hama-1]BCV20310.1 hypothetical protein hamaS1_03790 [Moorella sp. Hama-1]
MYKVKPKNTNRFKHDFQGLERQERDRVWQALKILTENPLPQNSICLEKNYYRLKIGNIRILYQLIEEENLILVGAVLRRNEKTYKDWKRYFK